MFNMEKKSAQSTLKSSINMKITSVCVKLVVLRCNDFFGSRRERTVVAPNVTIFSKNAVSDDTFLLQKGCKKVRKVRKK